MTISGKQLFRLSVPMPDTRSRIVIFGIVATTDRRCSGGRVSVNGRTNRLVAYISQINYTFARLTMKSERLTAPSSPRKVLHTSSD